MPDIGEDRIAVAFDFYDGYTLVPTAKVVEVTEECTYEWNSRKRTLVYSQIIDRNGKEVLSSGPYPFNINPAISRDYPQAGSYMVYDQLSTKRLRMKTDAGDEVILHWLGTGTRKGSLLGSCCKTCFMSKNYVSCRERFSWKIPVRLNMIPLFHV